MVAVGLQMLDVVIVPNGIVIGSDGTKGGALTEGLKGLTEDDGDAIKAAFADATLAAAGLVGPMIVVGHTVISPSETPGNGANICQDRVERCPARLGSRSRESPFQARPSRTAWS
jgi:hypothetical protein